MNRKVTWILNGVIAALSLLAILCYLFAPVWQLRVACTFPTDEILDGALGEDIRIGLSVRVDSGMLVRAFGRDADGAMQQFLDGNVNSIVGQMNKTLLPLTRTALQTTMKETLQDEIYKHVSNHLTTGDGDTYTEEEIRQRLEKAGVTDTFIDQKTTELFDAFYSGTGTVDSIGDRVLDTVEDTYARLAESDPAFQGATLSDEARQSVRATVSEVLTEFASPDGKLIPDEILDRVLLEMLRAANSEEAGSEATTVVQQTRSLAASTNVRDELTNEVRTFISGMLPSGAAKIFAIALRAIAILVLFSACTWLYILIKLVVKLARKDADPTVRLKLPLWLGWLPFLFLVCLPTLLYRFITRSANIEGMEEVRDAVSLSFRSAGWLALLAAGGCFVISIVYMVFRSRAKRLS